MPLRFLQQPGRVVRPLVRRGMVIREGRYVRLATEADLVPEPAAPPKLPRDPKLNSRIDAWLRELLRRERTFGDVKLAAEEDDLEWILVHRAARRIGVRRKWRGQTLYWTLPPGRSAA